MPRIDACTADAIDAGDVVRSGLADRTGPALGARVCDGRSTCPAEADGGRVPVLIE
jgi:hypothetical protein